MTRFTSKCGSFHRGNLRADFTFRCGRSRQFRPQFFHPFFSSAPKTEALGGMFRKVAPILSPRISVSPDSLKVRDRFRQQLDRNPFLGSQLLVRCHGASKRFPWFSRGLERFTANFRSVSSPMGFSRERCQVCFVFLENQT